eukprot:TRINITY_DN827_c0_g1_i4.p1 TRINITY_DN827_c0_g1~~TRINITY_DN827_c0_g1_i4.p1  ORF type:complete len:577 (+),score=281.53 TRINITY_DN827_c0_g1_i4:112-1842(+)
MLVLFETAAGFALFKVLDEGKLSNADDLGKDFQTLEGAQKIVKLKAFQKFENMTQALAATTAVVESKLSKNLKKFLKSSLSEKDLKDSLAISDPKLAITIKKKVGIQCLHDSMVDELMRGIRHQFQSLIPVSEVHATGTDDPFTTMSLGLAHSLSRYKLKFSPDKVDTMIVQAIALLDDLDKELNTYIMRVREWYGWHFPELTKVISDNTVYAKVVKTMGIRSNALETDFSGILPEELAAEVKEAAQISMGTEISEEDIDNIKELCDQVLSISEYREQLFDYLKNRMQAIAPNLSVLVGELVGARLIAHAGNLMNLAKHPASTVQILGAEKALFRALKAKHETPKYGLIYHASLIGQTAPKYKGKISRMLASKCALSVRVDALSEDKETPNIGIENRAKIEARMKQLEGKPTQISGLGKKGFQAEKYDYQKSNSQIRTPGAYNPAGDSTLGSTPKKIKKEEEEEEEDGEENGKEEVEDGHKEKKVKKEKGDKKKKAKKEESEEEEEEEEDESESESESEEEGKKAKKVKKDKKEKEKKKDKKEKKDKKKDKKEKGKEKRKRDDDEEPKKKKKKKET